MKCGDIESSSMEAFEVRLIEPDVFGDHRGFFMDLN